MSLSNLSIVIPTYNGALYLADAIDSIQKQTTLPIEIIVVDDCSTDESVSVAQKLSEESIVPIRLVRLLSNSGGPSAPINVGVKEASGELILVLDQDDMLEERALQDLENALQLVPRALCAFHLAGVFENRSERRTISSNETIQKIDSAIPIGSGSRVAEKGTLLEILVQHGGNLVVGYPGFAFRRSAFLEKGGVSEDLKIAGDMELVGWLFRTGASVYVPRIGYYRRLHDQNVCRNARKVSFEIALVLGNLCAVSSNGVNNTVRDAAIAKIGGYAYWFRKANLFNQAVLLYKSLKQVGVSRGTIFVLVSKCYVEMSWAKITRRRPTYSTYTGDST